MDIDPFAAQEDAEPADSAATTAARRDRLNTYVAITVALLATFAGICKVKDDNIVQAMQQAQADKLDHWSFYQARNLRQEVAEATVAQLTAASVAQGGKQLATYAPVIAKYQALAADQATKKAELLKQAATDQEHYDALNFRDDQFDLSDALTAIAIALLALTSLTHKRWLFGVALVATALGVLMGLSGLAGWHIHPDSISAMLS